MKILISSVRKEFADERKTLDGEAGNAPGMVLTIEEIRRWNVSKRRNPLIAELLRRVQMVEAWGHGMPLILKNEPNVKFRKVAGIFIADFDRPSFVEEAQEPTDKSLPATGKATGKEEDLLRILRGQPEATIPEMAAELGLTEDGINYHLN